jgi:ribosomal protein S18 acetylase RimI-like enzyme
MKRTGFETLYRRVRRVPETALRLALPYLPAAARRSLIRAAVDVPLETPKGLKLKIATTRAELEGAFRLVHDAYVAEGFMTPDPSGMRATKFHLLPTTTTLIGKVGDEVVATVSVVQDGAFGVPMDAAFDLSALRTDGRRIAEISSLAVAPAFRRRGAALWLVTKLMLRYSLDRLGLDCWVASANPKHTFLYEGVWNFRRLDCAPVAHYDFANGAPAVPWFADLESWMRELYAAYGECKATGCLPRFYDMPDPAAIELPERPYRRAFDNVMTPDLLRYFFPATGRVMAALTPRERAALDDLQGITPARRPSRFNVDCEARLTARHLSHPLALELRTVSETGFGAKIPRFHAKDIALGEPVSLEVAVGDFRVARVAAAPVVVTPGGTTGFKVAAADEEWRRFLDHLTVAWSCPGVGVRGE